MVADYLAHFELDCDPFEGDTDSLFSGGGRDEQFSQCSHAAQFSATLLFVTGEEGAGKSAWARALAGQMQSQDQVVLWQAPLLTDCQQLQDAVAEQLDIFASDLHTTLTQEPTTSGLAQTHIMLLVDDAHQLDDESLHWLVEMAAAIQNGDCHTTHIVLLGLPVLAERVEELAEPMEVVRQHYPLEPLSDQDTKAYLRWRLHAAGFRGPFPFDDQQVQQLRRDSLGLPGRLHDAARQQLIELAVAPVDEGTSRLGLPLRHMAVVVGLMALLIVVGLFWGDEEPAAVSTPLPLAVSEPATTVPAPVASQPRIIVNNEEPETEEPESVVEPSPPPSPVPDPVPLVLDEVDVMEEKVDPLADLDPVERQLLNWGDGYTIQILASASQSAVENFVAGQENGDELLVYRANRPRGQLYIVVTGYFTSVELARVAIARLPASQRKASPWPRSTTGVKRDIESFHGL